MAKNRVGGFRQMTTCGFDGYGWSTGATGNERMDGYGQMATCGFGQSTGATGGERADSFDGYGQMGDLRLRAVH